MLAATETFKLQQGRFEERVAALPQVLNEPVLTGQVEEVEQKLQSVVDLGGLHAEDPAEVHHGLLDGELAVEGDLLGHVADPFTRHPGALGARFAAQHPDLAGVQPPSADYAGEEGGFATARGTQEAISAEIEGCSYSIFVEFLHH